jgi:hypothetical protein
LITLPHKLSALLGDASMITEVVIAIAFANLFSAAAWAPLVPGFIV